MPGPDARHVVTPARAVLAGAALLALAACGGGHPTPSASGSPSPSAAAATPSPTVVALAPLTGLPQPVLSRLRRPALSVKIDNVRDARPQYGLNAADIVFDMPVEGGLTRLFAVFQSQDAAHIGPIRSARPGDAQLLGLLHGGILAFSGADPREIAPTKAHGEAVLVSNDARPQYFRRTSARWAPHNVVSDTDRLYRAGAALGHPKPPPVTLFQRSAVVPPGVATTHADVRYGAARASWAWVGSHYLRTQDGTADVLADGTTVSTENVVIMAVSLLGTGIIDDAGNQDPLVVTIGSGPCWVLRDGVMVRGTWKRPTYRSSLRFVDATGKVLSLRPGRTWVELMPRRNTPAFS